MTQLVCNITKILNEGPIDGVIRIAPEHVQYAGDSLTVPEFEDKELVKGQATFENVQPGKAVIQVHWGFNRQATIRVTVPDTETVRLEDLALGEYDVDPVVVGQIVEQAASASASVVEAARLLRENQESALESAGYARDSEGSADRAKGEADNAYQEAQNALGHAEDAHLYRQGALTYREGSRAARDAAQTERDAAEAAKKLAEQYRDGAKDHREAASLSEANAETSATAASTDANRADTRANEISAKLQQALDAIDSAEGIEQALRELIADTEAWQNVQTALEGVDADIATAVNDMRDEILGGVGPAFDTLLELAEALGENADAIGTLTNELAKKSEKGHTHKSADITDATSFLSSGDDNKVVLTGSDGHINSGQSPTGYNHLTRKGWVDARLATKAEKNHTHTVTEVSGLQTALDAKSPVSHIHSISEVDGLEAALAARSAEGHKHKSADITDADYKIGDNYAPGTVVTAHPTNGDIYRYGTAEPSNSAALVNKFYVDREVAKKADTGHTHSWSQITSKPSTFEPNSHTHDWSEITGTPTADLGYNNMTADDTPSDYPPGPSYAMSNGITYGWNEAIRKDVPDAPASSFVMIQTMRQRIYSGSTMQHVYSYNSEHRPVYVRNWYHGESKWGPFRSLTDDGHKHTSADITDAVSYVNGSQPSRVVTTHSTGALRVTALPTNMDDVAQKKYVDGEVAKKADSSHTHGAHEIRFDSNTVGSDTYKIGPNVTGNKVVVTGSDGQIWLQTAAVKDAHHVTNKQYVDSEVAKKANSNHTHTVSEISDLNGTYRAGRSVDANKFYRISGTGRLYYDKMPAASDELVNKSFVESRTPPIEVVSSLPSSPDPSTVYIIT